MAMRRTPVVRVLTTVRSRSQRPIEVIAMRKSCRVLIAATVAVLLAAPLLVLSTGCSSKSAAEPTTAGNDGTKAVSKADLPKTEGVDVDLTKMSSTMVYSEVLNMQKTPEAYEGKVVKMSGPFNVTDYNGKTYFACIIADATACCMQGMEFVPFTEPEDPDHFMEDNADITVTGRLETYVEDGAFYLHLVDASVEQNEAN